MRTPRVPVEIAGRSASLSYSLAAMAELQTALGVASFEEVLAALDALQPNVGESLDAGAGQQRYLLRIDLPQLLTIVWAGLGDAMEDGLFPRMTARQLGREVGLGDIPGLLLAVTLAVAAQFARPPTAGDNPEPRPTMAPAPTTAPLN